MDIPFQYGEERALAALLAVRRPDGLATLEAERLARWEGGLVRVRRCPVADAKWRPGLRRDSPSRILIPASLRRWDASARLLHELAHPLLHVGLGAVADVMEGDEARRFPLARRAEQHEEQLADHLVLALRLPTHVVAAHIDPRELANQVGLPWSVVEKRCQQLRGQVLRFTSLPLWCAGRAYELAYHPAPEASLQVAAAGQPLLRIPVDGTTRAAREMRLKADLVAFRPQEFQLKYARFRREDLAAGPWRRQVLPVCMDELYAWAQAGSAAPYGER